MSTRKDQIQSEAQTNWEENNYKGAIGICTGGGKSKIFINILSKTPEKWLLVVPTTKLRDEGWRDEFKKWKKLTLFNKYVDKCCYASLHKYDLSKYKGVCLDEGHNITANNTRSFLKDGIYDKLKILFLSATIPQEWRKINLMTQLDIKPVYTLSLDEGVKLGIVAPYNINIIKIPLDKRENKLVKYKRKGKEFKFYTSEYANYQHLTKTIAVKKDKGEDIKFNLFNRMRFIYNLESKKEIAKKLLEKIDKNERTLVFCQSIKQVEELCSCTYHSKTDNKCYNDFLQEKLNRLGVVMSLNEGTNVPNLDNGVIVQLNSKSKDLIQRIGRIVRYRKGHIANIYILVSKDTVDEKWLENAMLSFNSDNIKYLDYNEVRK